MKIPVVTWVFLFCKEHILINSPVILGRVFLKGGVYVSYSDL